MKIRNLVLTAGLALPGAAFGDFLNGSFEVPDLGTGMTQAGYTGTALTDWNLTGPSAGYVLTNQDAGVPGWDATTWYATPDGNQFLYVSAYVIGGEVLSQSVNLSAGSNTLQFLEADFAAPFNYGSWTAGGAIDVSVFGPTNLLVAAQSFTTPDFSSFIGQSLTFNAASAGSYTFDFTSVQNHAGIIDGVTVNAVPEPTSLVVLAGTGLCFGLRRKRKRS